MDAARLLAGLDDAQRWAVTHPHRPLAILAPAGSGKTRVLTRRLAWQAGTGEVDPRRALCLSFTREAAGEVRARLGRLGLRELPAAGTFHAIAYALLRSWWAGRRRRVPQLLVDRAGYLGRLFPELGPVACARLEVELAWARAREVDPADYPRVAQAASRRPPGGAAVVAEQLARYRAACRRAELVDFDDLLDLCAAAFDRDPAFADAQRWRFRHFFVDEFQDVNPLQLRLLRAWLGPGDDVIVVGDPAQAIYGWNGADPGFLDGFTELFPGAEVCRLDRNHRSTAQVVAVAAAALGAGRCEAPEAGAGDGPVPTVVAFADERAEARGLAAWCRSRYVEGVGWSGQAVLVRTNALARQLAEALQAAGVPGRLLLARPGRSATAGLVRIARQAPTLAALAADAASGSLEGVEAQGQRLLVELVQEYQALDPSGTPAGFAEWLAGPAASGRPSAEVTVATFHAAKGLEWQAVHVAGLEDGTVPAARSTGPAARAEERRLLHVALSRASRRLACSWCEVRLRGGRAVRRAPSPFLAEVESACAELAEAARACPAPPGLRPLVSTDRPSPVTAAPSGAATVPAGVAADDRSPLTAPPSGVAAVQAPSAPDDRSPLTAPPSGVTAAQAPSAPDSRSPRAAAPSGVAAAQALSAADDRSPLAVVLAWREHRARALGVAPVAVLADTAVQAVATRPPSSVDDLAQLPGIGPARAARLAPSLLAALAAPN